ncbi:D-2-hydroxyacid dehydrogenase [Opitutus sp. ER46]|uniref:D-2-hydroxyacid dehydrogenase n=1 Tax=Opitutus sp. ER46 TaxID=2161864 RepID=UPI000D305599|nr:D-2-hydroxyacid dehydrogenase [Opitutus sp. ER46]PTX95584.1 D-2-hydroxyacid dehydrogenase [Opitutus sp. ER46]
MPLTIWCNAKFSDADTRLLVEGTRGHRLVFSDFASANVLSAGRADPALEEADVALGQPDPAQCVTARRLRWVEVTTAGYTRYDTPEFKEEFRSRGRAFTNMSAVFADSCAQHVLAMMLALGRRLLDSHRDQLTDHGWHYAERRYQSRRLTGQNVLLLGYGAIGRRLAELLAPFHLNVQAVRRQVRSERGVRILPEEAVSTALSQADHVVNLLPDNESTRNYVNARRLACCKPGARFYNVGRGTTVDQRALAEALRSGRIAEAYLDVFEVEPLPPEDPLWTTPNCYITPHTAGGRADQDTAIVEHFLRNLAAFSRGEPMIDRVV